MCFSTRESQKTAPIALPNHAFIMVTYLLNDWKAALYTKDENNSYIYIFQQDATLEIMLKRHKIEDFCAKLCIVVTEYYDLI